MKDLLYKLLEKVGAVSFIRGFIIKYANDFIDKYPASQIISDGLVQGKTLKEIVRLYVESTATLTDDNIDELVDDIIISIKTSINVLDEKPLLDIILDIKIAKDKTIGEIPIPDFDNDKTNDIKLKEFIVSLLD